MRRRCLPCCVWIAIAGSLTATPLGAAELGKLWIAGNEQTVWIAQQRWEDSQRTIRLYYGDRDSLGIFTSPTLPDRIGDAIGLAVDDTDATLIFSDHTTVILTFHGASTGPRWPGDQSPIAWCGDAARPDIYALGEGASIELPIRTTSQTARRAGKRAAPSSRPTTRPAGGLTLMRLHYGSWQIAGVVPRAARNAARFWMSARDGRVHLFWRTAPDRTIECATFADGGWSDSISIPETDRASDAWAAADASGPVLAIAAPKEGIAQQASLRVAWRASESWHISGPLADDAGPVTIDPTRTAVSVARGKLAIVRLNAANDAELGQSSLDGDRTITWLPTTLLNEGPALNLRSPNLGWIETLTLMVVMTAIIWTKQETLTRPVSLPQTLMIAPPIRRMVALIIDLLPAVLLSGWLWVGPIKEALLLWPRVIDDPRLSQSLWASRVLPAWYFVAVVYAIYCGIWEWFSCTTPGKHFLGCRVVAAGGVRPDWARIVSRNCLRIPELGLPLAGMFSVFLMAVMSRNHQRIGDVVAGTYVVSPAPPLARPVGLAVTRRTASHEGE